MCKISDKTVKILSNHGHLFWDPLVIWMQCIQIC